MQKDLPNYNITIDPAYSDGEQLGINKIAFTATPAIRIKGMAFKSEVKQQSFSDELKYRIASPMLVPGSIYRCDEEDGEFYVTFTTQEIEAIHKNFMVRFDSNSLFNLEHNSSEVVPAYLLETILVDSENKVKMIKDEYSIDVPMGTSFIVTQITDKDYYTKLVADDAIGFSIEGFLGMKLSEHIKQKQEKMNELMLPDGEHQIGEKIYIIKDGAVIEVKDVVSEEMAVEEPIQEEDIKEEEVDLAEAPVEAPVAEATPAIDAYSKEEIDAKFEELYKAIAELKTEEAIKEEAPVEEAKFTEIRLSQIFKK
jgi:hypothetical protein